MARITIDHVRDALALLDFDALAAHARMAPSSRRVVPPEDQPPPRQAAVMVLLYPDDSGALQMLLTRRGNLPDHSGQVSFPGGQRDPEDVTFTACALRELCEEIGVCDTEVTVLGALTTIYIPPSHFMVHPTVGCVEVLPSLNPNPYEVAEVFALPLDALINDDLKRTTEREFRGTMIRVPYYQVGDHEVWGATAVMISEFEHRLRAVL